MAENREFVIQQGLKVNPEQKQDCFIFPEGTVVWPLRSKRGVLSSDLQARKMEGEKIAGYQAWVAEGPIHLYLDKRHWQLSASTRFGAPTKSAKK